jgi:ABC-type transporter Mla maintaining outer membrane lipid asymmetry ATPase subunit MlaF
VFLLQLVGLVRGFEQRARQKPAQHPLAGGLGSRVSLARAWGSLAVGASAADYVDQGNAQVV